MKHMKKALLFAVIATLAILGCKKESHPEKQEEISQATLDRIYNLGFSNKNVQKHEEGYLVEGDIVITEAELNRTPETRFLRIGGEEQYRTYNLVGSLPRTITVSVSNKLSSTYISATDEAINRFNAENISLHFQRVTSGGNIVLSKASGNYLASAGFPSGGNPYNSVKINSSALRGQPLNTIASVIAHELGHCIGFRHTDYMNRSFSCGGSPVNEGSAGIGAVLIPGTPSGPDANSWMLSCIGSGQNRPFNSNDKTALNYLY